MRQTRPPLTDRTRPPRWRVLLVACAALALGVASAQATYPDLPPGHWAEESVLRMAERGIIVGFPDGTFRGDDRLSRYEAAALVVRLVDAAGYPLASVEAALDHVAAGALDLGSRLDRLEARSGDRAVARLEGRIGELEDELAGLRAQLGLPPRDGVPGPAAGAGLAGSEGGVGPAGPAGGAPAAAGAGPSGVAGAPAAGGAGDGTFLAAVRPLFVSATIGASPEGVPIRAVLGHDALLGTAGLRGTLDLSLTEAGLDDVAVAAHVTRRFGGGRWSGYLGAGVGYRHELAGVTGATRGPFMGAVLGVEYAIDDRWGLVLEGTVDHHLRIVGRPLGEGPLVRPSLVVGASFRF